jgi:hypothetical protein
MDWTTAKGSKNVNIMNKVYSCGHSHINSLIYICYQWLSPVRLCFLIPDGGEVYSIQLYVIKFVSDLQRLGGFSQVTLISSTNTTDNIDIVCLLFMVFRRGVQHYVIKFVSDLRQVCGFLRVLWFPPPIKLTATI